MKNIKIRKGVSGVYHINPKVLKFRNSTKINESDIDNLFKGTLRLLKLLISESIESKYLSKINSLEQELKKYKERAKY